RLVAVSAATRYTGSAQGVAMHGFPDRLELGGFLSLLLGSGLGGRRFFLGGGFFGRFLLFSRRFFRSGFFLGGSFVRSRFLGRCFLGGRFTLGFFFGLFLGFRLRCGFLGFAIGLGFFGGGFFFRRLFLG